VGTFNKHSKEKQSPSEEEIEKAIEKGFIGGLKYEIH